MSTNIEFKLVVMKDDKEEYSSAISYDSFSNIINNSLDVADNNDLFMLAALHPASSVREALAYKDNLSVDVFEILVKDTSISVLRNLVRTNAFREFATQEIVEKLISLDVEIAQSIASNFESIQDVDSSKLISILSKHEDPAVLLNLVQNYNTPKKLLKEFCNHPNRYIALEAKTRLEN